MVDAMCLWNHPVLSYQPLVWLYWLEVLRCLWEVREVQILCALQTLVLIVILPKVWMLLQISNLWPVLKVVLQTHGQE